MPGIGTIAATMPGRVASLLPNDLGLFDMLGNVYEWCQEPHENYQPAKVGAATDDINMNASIDIDNPRLLRGGAFTNRPSLARARTVTGSPCRSGTTTSVSASPGLTPEVRHLRHKAMSGRTCSAGPD